MKYLSRLLLMALVVQVQVAAKAPLNLHPSSTAPASTYSEIAPLKFRPSSTASSGMELDIVPRYYEVDKRGVFCSAIATIALASLALRVKKNMIPGPSTRS